MANFSIQRFLSEFIISGFASGKRKTLLGQVHLIPKETSKIVR